MESRALRRIKRGNEKGPGRGYKSPEGRRGPSFLLVLAVSILIHAAFVAGIVYFPRYSKPDEKVTLYSVTLTTLPGPAGGGGKSHEEVKPPKKPEKKPPEKEAVKLASKAVEKRPPEREKIEQEPVPVTPPAPAGPGQGPAGGGKKGVTQGPIAIEGTEADFPFTFYLITLQKKVERMWDPPSLWTKQKPRAVIYFRIDKAGRITDVEIEESSGIELYDQKAVVAVKKSAPLPPLPAGYKGKRLGVHYTFIPEG